MLTFFSWTPGPPLPDPKSRMWKEEGFQATIYMKLKESTDQSSNYQLHILFNTQIKIKSDRNADIQSPLKINELNIWVAIARS